MVNVLNLPVVIYGKLTVTGRVPQGGRILSKHSTATAAVVRAIEAIPDGFGWAEDISGKHAPCFGFAQVGGSHVVLRLMDVGKDDQGRPHCFRLEAALLSGDCSSADSSILAALLSPAAWPRDPIDPIGEPIATLQQVPPEPRLLEAIATQCRNQPVPSILVGDPHSFTNSYFGIVINPATCEIKHLSPLPTRNLCQGNATPPHIQPSHHGIRRKHPWAWLIVGLLLGASCAGVPLGWWTYGQYTQLSAAQRRNDRQQDEIATRENAYAALEEKLRGKDVEITTAKKDRSDLRRDLNAWVEAGQRVDAQTPDQLGKKIQTLRQNADEFLREESVKLIKQRDRFKNILSKIRADLMDFNEVEKTPPVPAPDK